MPIKDSDAMTLNNKMKEIRLSVRPLMKPINLMGSKKRHTAPQGEKSG